MANFRNLAFGLVKTPPSPAASGTTLGLEPGHGARMPAVPFTATVWSVALMPDPTNAEVVLVTALVNDQLTLVRAQEGTTARAIVAGDQFAGTITKAYLDAVPLKSDPTVDWAGHHTIAGNLAVAGALYADTMTATHDTAVYGNSVVAGNVNIGGAAGIVGTLVAYGATTLGNGLHVSGGDANIAGDLIVAGVIQGAKLRGYSEPWHGPAVNGGVVSVDLLSGNHALVWLTENVASITILNLPSGNVIVPVMVYYIATGGPRTVAHVINGHGVRFAGGQQPVMSTDNGYIDRVLYTTWDGGVTWLGDIIGMHY